MLVEVPGGCKVESHFGPQRTCMTASALIPSLYRLGSSLAYVTIPMSFYPEQGTACVTAKGL